MHGNIGNNAQVSSAVEAFKTLGGGRNGFIASDGRINVNALRTFLDTNGRSCVTNGSKILQTNAPATLRYDEWKDIDRAVIEIAVDRLVGIKDLIGGGLVHNLGSIGQTISQYQRQSNITGASVSMTGLAPAEKDRPEFDTKTIPVPVVFKDFQVNIRNLTASRAFGESIDTVMAGMAGRVVAEKSEDMLFAGQSVTVDGSTIYGYTTHPDRATASMSTAWGSATGAQILTMVQAALTAARAKRMFGPFTMYIPTAYEGVLDGDHAPGTSDNRTIRQRILQLSLIRDIKTADRLATGNVLLVQLTKDVVDLAMAQDITTVQWTTNGGLVEDFKVMAVWVPRVKSTYDGQCGVVHIS